MDISTPMFYNRTRGKKAPKSIAVRAISRDERLYAGGFEGVCIMKQDTRLRAQPIVVLVILGLGLLGILAPVAADTSEYDAFVNGFTNFAEALANDLPFNTMIGLNTSDAYIGSLPHFGLGLTVGATMIPIGTFQEAMDPLGVDLGNELGELQSLGFPLPAAVLDARIGGFFLPFDLGFKIGYLPDEAKVFLPENMNLNYLMVGGDIRYAIVQEKGWLPDVSVGLGYTYLKGDLNVSGVLGGNQEIANVQTGPSTSETLELQDPDVNFNWQASVIDLKIQVSKSILLITPFAGMGISYGASSTGGGLRSDVLISGTPITQSQIQQIEDYYSSIGETVPDLSDKGILITSDAKGWAYRVFGGLSLNVFVMRINLNGMYNFTTGALGASIATTLQF